jgi:tRNA 2-thiouridine synthesizing protein E
MKEIQISDRTIELNEEGFLIRPEAWTPEVAEELARAHNIQLTERHWEVINFCRQDFEETGEAPGLRRITKKGGVPTKEIYQLFPGGPGKLSAKLAGLHKPTSCV